MYENNYNYIDVPNDDHKMNTRTSTGKIVAIMLSAALIGGVSGFGGAYLQNSLDSGSIPETSTSVIQTPAIQKSSNSESLLNAASSHSEDLTTRQIVQKVSPSVVSVHSSFAEQEASTGTGIILSEDGYIITNAHVVQTEISEFVANKDYGYSSPFGGGDLFDYFFGNGGYGGNYRKKLKKADTVKIILSSDDETEYEAEIVGADESSDLAVLKIDTTNIELTPAEFGDSSQLIMGDKAVAIGYPLGLGLSTSEGIVSGINRTLNVELSNGGSASMTLIQTDAAINPGNSGGPLVNSRGQVVGITSSKLVDSSVEGLGFAIPISDAMPLISDLMNKGYVTKTTPQIGVTCSDINSATKRYYNLPVDEGVMVVSVTEGSGAELAGICEGDVIIAADGEKVSSMEDLTAAKKGKKVGDTIVLTLARSDVDKDVIVTLTAVEEPEVESN